MTTFDPDVGGVSIPLSKQQIEEQSKTPESHSIAKTSSLSSIIQNTEASNVKKKNAITLKSNPSEQDKKIVNEFLKAAPPRQLLMSHNFQGSIKLTLNSKNLQGFLPKN